MDSDVLGFMIRMRSGLSWLGCGILKRLGWSDQSVVRKEGFVQERVGGVPRKLASKYGNRSPWFFKVALFLARHHKLYSFLTGYLLPNFSNARGPCSSHSCFEIHISSLSAIYVPVSWEFCGMNGGLDLQYLRELHPLGRPCAFDAAGPRSEL